MSLSVEVAAKSDVGCVRQNNEDFAAYDTSLGVFLVLDGMGGQAAGEVASRIGAETVLKYFREAAKQGSWPVIGEPVGGASARGNALASAIRLANDNIHAAASEQVARKGMGSTIVSVLVSGGFFSVAHVGDSRVYLLRGGELRQLTNDHSLVMEQVRRGIITRAEAEKSEMQNIIIRALGPEKIVEPEIEDEMARPGDMLLLATDGLTRLVPDHRLQAILTSHDSLPVICDALVQAAKDAGGDDNITCMVLRIAQEPWYKHWFKPFLTAGGSQWQSST